MIRFLKKKMMSVKTSAGLKVPFLDLRVSSVEKESLLEAIARVFEHGRFILGPEVERLEALIANYCRRKFAIGTGSGTDALFLALKALQIGPGDEVITTSLSWIATTNAIAMTGATVVFADIGDDLNIDPESVRHLITKKTKAIVPVHYTGKVCNVDALRQLADQNKVKLIEDAAQAFGALYREKPAGSFGDVACFSMNPMKVFAACGEAGMVLTDDGAVYERLIALRYNGTVNKESCIATSLNGRLDTIQAAILIERLSHLDAIIAKRRQNADFYNKSLADVVRVPFERPYEKDIYYTYQIQTSRRDALKHFLEDKGIEVKIQHPMLMCEQAIYRKLLCKPVVRAQQLVKEILCLPIHEKLEQAQLEYVVETIKDFY